MFATDRVGKEVTRITTSGTNGKYNVFASAGQSISGINKKGKEFFRFDTNHTEVIKNLTVKGTQLWSCGDFILNSYVSGKDGIQDQFFYISQDKINDLQVPNVQGDHVSNCVLACED